MRRAWATLALAALAFFATGCGCATDEALVHEARLRASTVLGCDYDDIETRSATQRYSGRDRVAVLAAGCGRAVTVRCFESGCSWDCR